MKNLFKVTLTTIAIVAMVIATNIGVIGAMKLIGIIDYANDIETIKNYETENDVEVKTYTHAYDGILVTLEDGQVALIK